VYEDPHDRKLRSAGNPTQEPNITMFGKPVAKLWPFLYIQGGCTSAAIFDLIELQIAPFDPPTRKP